MLTSIIEIGGVAIVVFFLYIRSFLLLYSLSS
jgi:hypothetical protein